jgi:hypothetical protein
MKSKKMCSICDTKKYIAIEAVLSKHDEDAIGRLVTAIQSVYNLHNAVNGPYDDLACEACTEYANICSDGIEEPIYIEYPCPTIKALDGEWNPLDHPVTRPEEQ